MTLPGGEFFDCLENTQVRRRYNAAEEFGEDRSADALRSFRRRQQQPRPLSFRSLKYSAGSGVACGGKSHGFSRQRFASRNTSARSRNEWTPSSASALIALSIGPQNF
jgi:hypothetical protein